MSKRLLLVKPMLCPRQLRAGGRGVGWRSKERDAEGTQRRDHPRAQTAAGFWNSTKWIAFSGRLADAETAAGGAGM